MVKKKIESSPATETDEGEPSSGSQLPWKLSGSDVYFAFGPQNGYYIRCGARWRLSRPKESVWDKERMKDIHWVSFRHTNGVFLGGEQDDGKPSVVHTWNDAARIRASDIDAFVQSRDAYQALFDWLCAECENDLSRLKDTSLAIGTNGSYFARCGSKWTAHAIPSDLKFLLDKEEGKIPVVVALGVRDAWVVLWNDGSRSWDLAHAYPGLQKTAMLDSDDSGNIVFVALDPYSEDHYLAARKNGGVSYNVALENRHESSEVNEITNQYMWMRAKQDGTDFSHSVTVDGKLREVTITPDTYKTANAGSVRLRGMWKDRRNLAQTENLMIIGGIAAGAGLVSRATGATPMKAITTGCIVGLGAALGVFMKTGSSS